MVNYFSISWNCRSGKHGGLLGSSRWNRTMNISGSVCPAFRTLWLAPITRPYVWKNLSMATWGSHEAQQKWKAKPVPWVHAWHYGWVPALYVVVVWEVRNSPQRKKNAEFDCVTRTKILKVWLKEHKIIWIFRKEVTEKKCTFSFHELKYECLLQSLLGNNPSLLSLLCWAYTKTAEFLKSCCLAPRNLLFS